MRYNRFLALTALLLAGTVGSPAVVRAAQEQAALEAVCKEIQAAKSQLKGASRPHLLWDYVRTRLAPGSVVRRVENLIPTPQGSLVSLPPGALVPSENLIFSIEPPADLLASADFSAMERRYDELTGVLSRDRKTLKKLIRAEDVTECVRRARETSFDFEAFAKLAKERGALQLVPQARDARKAREIVAKTVRKLKLPWKIVPATDLQEVYLALRRRNVRHVVLLSHGLTGGKLLDSRMNEYPAGFFSDLSPTLRSLTIFACHGEDVPNAYQLASRLSETSTIHPLRSIIVSDGTRLFGVDDVVPLDAFKSFMKKVEKRLRELEASAPAATHAPALAGSGPTCAVKFDGLEVTRGTLGLLLNGRFVGSLNAAAPVREAGFPCRFVDRKRNILVIRNLGLLWPAAVAAPSFTAEVRDPERKVTSAKLSHYLRPGDGTYQSSKLEFELE